MTRKYLVIALLASAFASLLSAQTDYKMLSITEDGTYYKNRLDVSDWNPGEDFVYLRSYYIPWQGEDSMDYQIRMGNLKINGQLVGVDLVENPSPEAADKSKIVTVQVDPAHLKELASLPGVVAVSFVGVKEADLANLKDMENLKALDLAYTKISDGALAYISPLTNLRVLNLANTQISDAGLKYLSTLTNLKALDLESTDITDSGIEYLKDLKELRSLNLFHTKATGGLALRGAPENVSDHGAKVISGLSALTELNLHGAELTDAGLAEIARLGNLRNLDLSATAISDASIENLSRMTLLRTLDLAGTDITPAGLRKLRAALPNTEINY